MIIENFIVFEGIDGAGTTTQMRKLAERLPPDKIALSAEPTDRETGRFLRRMLRGEFQTDSRTAAYLFAADRAEHLYGAGGILEQAAGGRLAVSDRYLFSSLAYQSVSCGEALPRLLNSAFPLPKLLFYFKIPPEQALERVAARGGTRELYEQLGYQQKAAERYESVIREYMRPELSGGMTVITVDAAASVGEISEFIWNHVRNLPIHKA